MHYIAILALVPSLPRAARAANDPSGVIFPEQSLPLLFSHREHLAMKLACDFCHAKAPSSTSAADDLIPGEEACRTCHKIERDKPHKEDIPAAACDECHVYPTGASWQAPPPVVVPPPNLKFNHAVHVGRGVACTRCHDMSGVKLATRAELPTMALCLGCHDQTATDSRAPSRCSTCHVTRPDGTLETEFAAGRLIPSGTLRGDAHGPDFVKDHRAVGRQEAAYCASCHRQDFCLACHNGVTKPLSFHQNDYLAIHSVEARKATFDCQACHRLQSFCLGCHERAGVTDPATGAGPNGIDAAGRRFHPPWKVWVAAPRTPEHHSWQAERNIRACAACHREDTCLECHTSRMKTGDGQPFNVDPHPPGFAGSRACASLAAKNARVCLKCHATSDPQLTCR